MINLKAYASSLEFGIETFHMIKLKNSDNCHPKLEHNSARSWQLHSSQSLQFLFVWITLFPSSYYTGALDQKGSQEPFSNKNLAFSFS